MAHSWQATSAVGSIPSYPINHNRSICASVAWDRSEKLALDYDNQTRITLWPIPFYKPQLCSQTNCAMSGPLGIANEANPYNCAQMQSQFECSLICVCDVRFLHRFIFQMHTNSFVFMVVMRVVLRTNLE